MHSSKNKLAFINGQIPQPTSTDSNFKAWERINNTIISWFMKVLDPQIARSVLYFLTTQEICQNLEERFGVTFGTQIYSLTQQIFDIDQGSDCLSTYYTKIKMLWDEFDASNPLPTCHCTNCTCGINSKLLQMREEQRLILFLMKLNPAYKAIRGNILMQQPLPSISHAYRLIMQEEKHSALASNINATTDEAIGLTAVNKKRFYDTNNNTASQSQNITYRPPHYGTNATNTRKSTLFCNYCKKQGHTKENCYRLHGFPTNSTRDNWNNKKVAAMVQADNSNNNQTASPKLTVDQYNDQLFLLLANMILKVFQQLRILMMTSTCLLAGKSCFLSMSHSTWIIDSGATNHMCSDLSLFSSYTTVSDNIDNSITIPNENFIKIAHKGTVILSP